MIFPLVGGSKPATMRSVVVLPHPLGPSSEKNSPAWISTEISSTAVTSSNRFVSDSSLTCPPLISQSSSQIPAMPVSASALPLVRSPRLIHL